MATKEELAAALQQAQAALDAARAELDAAAEFTSAFYGALCWVEGLSEFREGGRLESGWNERARPAIERYRTGVLGQAVENPLPSTGTVASTPGEGEA